KISRWAVGDATTTESAVTYSAPAGLTQNEHLDGMPLGTRGGMRVEHNFPLDAEYVFSIRGGFSRGAPTTRVEVTLDGQRLELEDTREFGLPAGAGEHVLTAAILDLRRPAGVNDIYAEYEAGGGVSAIEIEGPFNASGVGDTASRRRVFTCYPANVDEEPGCAREIVSDISSRAFRRPAGEDDIAPAMAFYQRGYEEGGFESGIQQALARILIDPRFLFRLEAEPAELPAGQTYAISDLDLATRLSFFLWSSIPDDELLELASRGELREPATLEAQVRRRLADPKAHALLENFAGQWLFLR